MVEQQAYVVATVRVYLLVSVRISWGLKSAEYLEREEYINTLHDIKLMCWHGKNKFAKRRTRELSDFES